MGAKTPPHAANLGLTIKMQASTTTTSTTTMTASSTTLTTTSLATITNKGTSGKLAFEFTPGAQCPDQDQAGWNITQTPIGVTCLKAITGKYNLDAGFLTLQVDSGDGLVTRASGNFAASSVVLDECYWQEITEVKAVNPQNDGWVGHILFSRDGGNSYQP